VAPAACLGGSTTEASRWKLPTWQVIKSRILFTGIAAEVDRHGHPGRPTGEALDISDSGLAVGTADLADGTHHAFVWQDGVMTDVGVVPGDSCTNGRASNSRGQAIGTSTDCMGNVKHMFLWQNGSITRLDRSYSSRIGSSSLRGGT